MRAFDKKYQCQESDISKFGLSILPVKKSEYLKFFLMCSLIFVTVFTFVLLRSIKDPLIATAPGSGAEVLSFLKIYLVLPLTIVFSFLYMKMRKNFSLYRSYFIIISFFVTFFLLFAFFLNPNVGILHPKVDVLYSLQDNYPSFRYLFVLWGIWTYCLFYVFSEMWGTFILSVLFWQFANDTTNSEQAKRFYPLYVMSGNLSLFALWPVLNHIVDNKKNDVFEAAVIASVGGIILMIIFWYLNVKVLKINQEIKTEGKTEKKKLSMRESLSILLQSKYIACIAILVLSYGVVINLFELVWKAEVVSLYATRSDYIAFNRDFTMITGVFAICMNYISKGVIRKMGWTFTAVITPVVIGICCIIFFGYILNRDFFAFFVEKIVINFTHINSEIGMVWFSVWLGVLGFALSKGSKYSFFDPTKEMSFIPLDIDLKTNAKAAVDGIGQRLGKSAGGAFASTLFMLMGSPPAIVIAPFLVVVILLLIIIWIWAVFTLGNLYNKKVSIDI